MEGFYTVTAISPKLILGDIKANVEILQEKIEQFSTSSLLLFPELSLTGYTLADLFFQQLVEKEVIEGLKKLAKTTSDTIVIVGAPLWFRDNLYNCAVVLQEGEIKGVVPKTYLANYKEFYEERWFKSGKEIKGEKILDAPFGVDLLFRAQELLIGIEVCEDLWAIEPPSLKMASSGANLICNLSASDELVGKHAYRKELVKTQSARGICAYAYASSGVGESSSDLLYSGALIIAENGAILNEGERFKIEGEAIQAQIDVSRLKHIRRAETSFKLAKNYPFKEITLAKVPTPKKITRYYDPHPFVPKAKEKREEHSKEIFKIQSHALARRVRHIGNPKLILGVSGGLDSTLALLVCKEACAILRKQTSDIIAVSMPGLGTSGGTKRSAKDLAKAVGATFLEIGISGAVKNHLKDISHPLEVYDVTVENAQARERTQILMDLANKFGGIVVGTGDLSEIALGFSTYNGDHISMYNVNAGVPKTLVKYLIEWVAQKEEGLKEILLEIISRPISPELLPPKEGEISQETEKIIGPYELHDFFLYHFIKEGASPKKLLLIASLAFKDRYSQTEIKEWLKLFLKRFFANQFKRNAMPDGVKVGSVALSPRGDWRMASDVSVKRWLEEL
ncbi:MAG: NAD(+) synthase [Epsilonproteobacteria bacterium]|nr:NAD(+) synthase [Campylobacterota bacterium]